MQCKSCGLEKDPSLFYKSNKSRCKECVKSGVKANRLENIEYYKEFDRNRKNASERNEATKSRNKRLYAEDATFKENLIVTKNIWAERNKHKRKAQYTLGNAVRDLKVVKPDSCEHCLSSGKPIQGHHWSYLQEHWLDVIWLCVPCHGKEHKRLNELGRDPDNIKGAVNESY